jgi:hypothetical protein
VKEEGKVYWEKAGVGFTLVVGPFFLAG